MSALPRNFTALPSLTYENPSINDDVAPYGCQYVEETIAERKHNDSTYANYTYLSDAAKPGCRDALNLTQEEVDKAGFL